MTTTTKTPKPKAAKAKKPKIVPVKFDYKTLSADILAKREKENLSFTDVFDSHGIPRHILFSIEAGKMVPSCVNFAAVLTWLGKPANAYFITVAKTK